VGVEDAEVEVLFSRSLTPSERAGVTSVVDDWYNLGSYDAYGLYLTGLFPEKSAQGGRRLNWDVNSGTVGKPEYLPLAKALQGYADVHHLPPVALHVLDPR
jgi:hypothetical protein